MSYTETLTACSISQNVSRKIQVLPDNERLDSTEFQGLEGVINTINVLAGILRDFVEVLLDQLLLLHELDV